MTKEELLKTLEASREALVQYQKGQEVSMKQSKKKDSIDKDEYDRDIADSVAQLQADALRVTGPGGHVCPRCHGSGRA